MEHNDFDAQVSFRCRLEEKQALKRLANERGLSGVADVLRDLVSQALNQPQQNSEEAFAILDQRLVAVGKSILTELEKLAAGITILATEADEDGDLLNPEQFDRIIEVFPQFAIDDDDDEEEWDENQD